MKPFEPQVCPGTAGDLCQEMYGSGSAAMRGTKRLTSIWVGAKTLLTFDPSQCTARMAQNIVEQHLEDAKFIHYSSTSPPAKAQFRIARLSLMVWNWQRHQVWRTIFSRRHIGSWTVMCYQRDLIDESLAFVT